VTTEQPLPLPQRQRGRSPTPWRSLVKLLGPILGLAAVGVAVAVAVLGLLVLAAAVLSSTWSGAYGSTK
jgi:hypothetical protein